MIFYTVIWKPEAERRLAAIWTGASNRKAVTDAANLIDQLLRVAPAAYSESRDEGRRILLKAPLGVIFELSEEDRMVTVVAVWHYEKRRRAN